MNKTTWSSCLATDVYLWKSEKFPTFLRVHNWRTDPSTFPYNTLVCRELLRRSNKERWTHHHHFRTLKRNGSNIVMNENFPQSKIDIMLFSERKCMSSCQSFSCTSEGKAPHISQTHTHWHTAQKKFQLVVPSISRICLVFKANLIKRFVLKIAGYLKNVTQNI